MDKNILLNIKKFRSKLVRDPRQKVHALLADNYRRVGLTEDAIEMCATGLELFPSYLLCCEVLGRILLRLGRMDEAKEQLEKVHHVVKDNIDLNRALAKLYMEMDNPDAAVPLLESVLAKDPFDFEMRNLLTGVWRKSQAPEWEEGADGNRDSAQEGVDLFDTRPKSKTFDIESILAQSEDVGEVPSRKVRASATTSLLDQLEDAEDLIETGAEELMASLGEGEENPRPAVRSERRDVYMGKEKELHGAAVLAQTHMEIHLLDEALNLLRKLIATEGDADFKDLSARLKEALDRKEEELDRLETQELARGL